VKAKLGLAFLSIAFGILIFRWYCETGYQQYPWPFPFIIGPLFRLDGESAEDEALLDTLIFFIVATSVILFGGDWLIRRVRSRAARS